MGPYWNDITAGLKVIKCSNASHIYYININGSTEYPWPDHIL